ncbi:MAG: hypothetical protein DMG62_00195 [Acidobacteria bacterium]|nr:MAG: hypothetical protein DMG62_00195 [Acidobacteriota bacterium]
MASCRRTFNWRVQRLLHTGHIARLHTVSWQRSPVYSVNQNGLRQLHALELNAIRVALVRNALLIEWRSEVEISSNNMVSGAHPKDYDAIVKIWLGNEIREFALEYERSLKSAKHYERIRAALEAERQIGNILYLVADSDLMLAILYHLTPLAKRIGFTTVRSFKEQLLAASVTTDADREMMTLQGFLEYGHPLYVNY